MTWQMACNQVRHPCGCVTWMQWESGTWVRKTAPCWQHEGEGR